MGLAHGELVTPLEQLINHYNSLDRNQIENLTVIFDIDDTILSNQLIINSDQGYQLDHVIGYQRLSKLPFIYDQKLIYDWCLTHNINVVFITFRCESERLQTIKNLKQQNISKWEKLILFPEPCDYKSISAKDYKTSERKKLIESGYHIIAAVGDQYSDIHGGYTDLAIKLEDPGYYTK